MRVRRGRHHNRVGNRNEAELLTGKKRVPQYLLEGDSQLRVIKDQKALPVLTYVQIKQAIALIAYDK